MKEFLLKYFYLNSICPNVWIQSCPILPKIWPKSRHRSLKCKNRQIWSYSPSLSKSNLALIPLQHLLISESISPKSFAFQTNIDWFILVKQNKHSTHFTKIMSVQLKILKSVVLRQQHFANDLSLHWQTCLFIGSTVFFFCNCSFELQLASHHLLS